MTTTHYIGREDRKFYCLACGPSENAEALEGKGMDYDDYDFNGGGVPCHSCCEYVFPEEGAAQDAENAAMMREVQRNAPIYRAEAMVAKQKADPVGFYLACKDDPGSLNEF